METIRIRQATKLGYVEMEIGGVLNAQQPKSKTRRGRVQDNGRVVPTIQAGDNGLIRIEKGDDEMFRIRKLTPLECWRLMGFKDEDFERAEKHVSATQLYKQAGNSICVNVLTAVIGQMIPGKENRYKEIAQTPRLENGARG